MEHAAVTMTYQGIQEDYSRRVARNWMEQFGGRLSETAAAPAVPAGRGRFMLLGP